MIASSITSAGNPAFPTNAQSGASITLDASALQTTVSVTTGASDSAAGGNGGDGACYVINYFE